MKSDDRTPTIAAALDALCIVVFVTIGRRNHDESSAMGGILRTAAPFTIALVVGWIAARAWRQPTSVRTGLLIWPIVIVVGMLLRHFVFDDGTAASFIVVATVFLGLFLVGWRAVWTLVASRRHGGLRSAT